MSPFAKKAKENNKYYEAGKPDDITIVVAQIKAQESLNSNNIP
jgi:hypothetical protein